LVSNITTSINNDEQFARDSDFWEVEVEKVIMGFKLTKSPGEDSFTAEFNQKFGT
jgi:hypothetical protein